MPNASGRPNRRIRSRIAANNASTATTWAVGEATVDLIKGRVERGDQVYHLGHFELEILKMLVESAEVPVERNKILDVIWGLEGFPANRTVDNHIVSLRRKLEPDPKHPRHIVTIHSIGYKFVP